jgi:hypothetical protein
VVSTSVRRRLRRSSSASLAVANSSSERILDWSRVDVHALVPGFRFEIPE